jgi:hypothetical protein
MPLDHAPASVGRPSEPRVTYTVDQYCAAHNICRSQLYEYWKQGNGPRFFWNGKRRLITIEAAADWRRQMEAAAIAAQTA